MNAGEERYVNEIEEAMGAAIELEPGGTASVWLVGSHSPHPHPPRLAMRSAITKHAPPRTCAWYVAVKGLILKRLW